MELYNIWSLMIGFSAISFQVHPGTETSFYCILHDTLLLSVVEGPWGFYCGSDRNNAAMIIYVYSYVWTGVLVSLGTFLGLELWS